MKISHFLFIRIPLLGLLFLLFSATSPDWRMKMNQLSGSLQQLMPHLVSESSFKDPSHSKQIGSALTDLAKLAHNVADMTKPEKDPSLDLIASLFESESEKAKKQFFLGFFEDSRARARTLASYCIGCHTRHADGSTFLVPSPSNQEDQSPQDLLQKADYWLATRHFEEALKVYRQLVLDYKWAKVQPLLWEKAVKKAVVVAVRAIEDPIAAISIVQIARKNPELSYYFEWDSEIWNESLSDWSNEEKKKRELSDTQYLAAAKKLISKGKNTWDSARDQAALVDFLRASTLLHRMLNAYPKSKLIPEALLYLGISYDALADLDQYTLHEWYYTACIQKAPKTEISKKCYRYLEEAIAGTYNRSIRDSMPADIAQRLSELRKQAIK